MSIKMLGQTREATGCNLPLQRGSMRASLEGSFKKIDRLPLSTRKMELLWTTKQSRINGTNRGIDGLGLGAC